MTSGLILEIGGGHKPSPAADVVVDKYLFDNTERAASLRITPRTIIADGAHLPFLNKSFSYTIGRQVMEHMDDIGRFFEEIMRVSSAGYLASPSYLRELAFFWSFHRWFITMQNDTLICAPKLNQRPIAGQLLHYFAATNRDFQRFLRSLPVGFLNIQYHWKDAIKYKIVQKIDPPPFHTFEEIEAYLANCSGLKASKGLKAGFLRILPGSVVDLVEQGRGFYFGIRRSSIRRSIDLRKLLACPLCRVNVYCNSDAYHCPTCQRSYPILNGIPIFLTDEKDLEELRFNSVTKEEFVL